VKTDRLTIPNIIKNIIKLFKYCWYCWIYLLIKLPRQIFLNFFDFSKKLPPSYSINLFLLFCLAIALVIRLINLTGKPPWTDEFSSIVFSLGNNFQNLPLDQIISIDPLIHLLQPTTDQSIPQVVNNLMSQSNHPPLYFILSHWWLKLFAPVTANQIVSLWGIRVFPVLCSILSIPAIYYLAKFAFRSRLVGKMSALMLTVSPYSIYLAQEARHYSLAILLVIASIYCYLKAIHYFFRKKPIPFPLIFIWIIVNAIGIAIHYLLIITIISQAISWLALIWYDRKNIIYSHNGNNHLPQNLQLDRLAVLTIGTILVAVIWLPVWRNGLGSELTAWIQGDNYLSVQEIFNPIFQILAAILTMFYLLPIESDNLWVSIPFIVIMVMIFFWLAPILSKALVNYQSVTAINVRAINIDDQSILNNQQSDRLNRRALIGIIVGSILIFLSFNYLLGIDLTRGARYNFVYFPAVIVLLGASFSQIYQKDLIKSDWLNFSFLPKQGKQIIYLLFLIAFLSSLTVVNNLGYQKYYRPDLLVNTIDQYYTNHPIPSQILIATTYKTHVQIGEILGIVWVWLEQFNDQPTSINSHQNDLPIKFIFNRYNRTHPANTMKSLTHNLQNIKQDFDLWLINYQGDFTPNDWQNLQKIPCQSINNQDLPAIDGYDYQIYHCLH
jgi:uncharacterized membrane protein